MIDVIERASRTNEARNGFLGKKLATGSKEAQLKKKGGWGKEGVRERRGERVRNCLHIMSQTPL